MVVNVKMPNASEVIERLARENEQRKILTILEECKDLAEAKAKIKALLQ